MEKYDLIIVGAGPAGIFTAVELLRRGSKKHILLVEKGKPVEKRHCPKAEIGHCVNCRPTCAITTGFSGAGAFSDGKLSLSYEVGGDLPSLIGEEFAQELIDYTDKIYLEFGADPHVEGIYTGEDIKEIRKNAIHAGLKLVDCPIRHLGTEKAQQLYLAIQNYLADNGVEMLFSTECENIILEDEECRGVLLRQGDGEPRAVYGDTVVIGTGRRGADWLEKICAEHHIAHKPGTVDIGVRVECRNEFRGSERATLARDQLHKRRLSRPVRTQQRKMLAFLQSKRVDRQNRRARTLHDRVVQFEEGRRLDIHGSPKGPRMFHVKHLVGTGDPQATEAGKQPGEPSNKQTRSHARNETAGSRRTPAVSNSDEPTFPKLRRLPQAARRRCRPRRHRHCRTAAFFQPSACQSWSS